MMISEAVFRALKGNPNELKIVADWIEDNYPEHREAAIYCHRLRDPKRLKMQTLIDTIAKFGTRQERKEICRIWRIALRGRKDQKPLNLWPTNLKSLEARRLINIQIGRITPRTISSHKRTVIANCKKRNIFLYCDLSHQINWWFLAIIKQLLQVVHSDHHTTRNRRP